LQQGGNFKGWLCQIARNVSASAVRREAGKPHGHSSRIEDAPELVDGKSSPVAEAISREEEAMVWRTLETLPENYRLPLILFHREGESIAAVAAALDLSEDAVKQRLARGREMLKQEVNSVIEGTLRRTNPGAQFTAAAIAGIGGFGGVTAKAAGLGTVTTSSAVAAKTFVGAGIFWTGIVPIISEWLTYFIISKQTRTREELSIFKRYAIYGSVATVAFTAWMIALRHLAWGQQANARLALLVISSVCFCGVRWTLAFLAVRKAGWLSPATKGDDGRR
jgi:RNA polymerase sigma factor (sigma-70 family)